MAAFWGVRQQLLLAVYCYILTHVGAIDITYPISSTVYPPKGPDKVQWVPDDSDPSEVLIYLATYSGSKITNYLKGVTWDTSSGSVDITTSQTAPIGQSWTWQFYDPTAALQLGVNQIAESPHFTIQGALLPTSPKKGLSAGAAAAVGVIVTLLVICGCLAAAWYFLYLPRKRQRPTQGHGFQSSTAKVYAGKHELGESEAACFATNPSPLADGTRPQLSDHQSTSASESSDRIPQQLATDRDTLAPTPTQAYHEMPGYYQRPHVNELPANPRQSAQSQVRPIQPSTIELDSIAPPTHERSKTRRKPVPVSREGAPTAAAADVVY